MNAADTILHVSIWIGLVLLAAAFLLTTWRVVKGPTLPDRVVALDMLVGIVIGFIALIAIRTGFTLYVDIAIALGLVGFLATVAFARFIVASAAVKTGSEGAVEAPAVTIEAAQTQLASSVKSAGRGKPAKADKPAKTEKPAKTRKAAKPAKPSRAVETALVSAPVREVPAVAAKGQEVAKETSGTSPAAAPQASSRPGRKSDPKQKAKAEPKPQSRAAGEPAVEAAAAPASKAKPTRSGAAAAKTATPGGKVVRKGGSQRAAKPEKPAKPEKREGEA